VVPVLVGAATPGDRVVSELVEQGGMHGGGLGSVTETRKEKENGRKKEVRSVYAARRAREPSGRR
jgi:hypothetical protein